MEELVAGIFLSAEEHSFSHYRTFICRCLLFVIFLLTFFRADPRILIFDEATSALDSESEHLVQKAMEEVVVGRTVLMIAHRISTIRHAHIIVAMENGKIVEMGSHDELVAKKGLYEKLVAAQMQNSVLQL